MLRRQWTSALQRAGWDVEILTTTIRELASDWNRPFHPPGRNTVDGVPVTRFPLTQGDHATFHRLNQKLLGGLPVSPPEEELFYREGPNSDDLNRFISRNRDNRWFIFVPYPFGTTYFGVQAAAHRAVMIPCCTDEAYARMECTSRIMEGVQGFIFNSKPEQLLAQRLYRIRYTPQIVLGVGLDDNISADGPRFRRKFGIKVPSCSTWAAGMRRKGRTV